MAPGFNQGMINTFEVTWDYRCPFARNAHEHLVTALEAGAEWQVGFRVFALDQAHVHEGRPPVWEEPDRYPGLLANEAGLVVRDRQPQLFHRAHLALFAARHDRALDLRQREVIGTTLDEAGVDGASVLSEIDAGWPLEVLRDEHSRAVETLDVFGVPTFMLGDRAVFVRLMDRPEGDAKKATAAIERVLELAEGWPELNEFKYTRATR
ncbi:MAG TPA: DsbA family protein [Acidimicrobiales bacterium]|nr:DsbA family protein [Acidimicrobiales bacterium]